MYFFVFFLYLITHHFAPTIMVCFLVFVFIMALVGNSKNKKIKTESVVPEEEKEYDIYNVEIQRDPSVTQNKETDEKPQKEGKKKLAINATNITFAIGILLIIVAGAVLITSSWEKMTDPVKCVILFSTIVLAFGLSALAGKGLKLSATSFAMYSLGTLLLPIVWIGSAGLGLLGDYLKLTTNVWLDCLISSLLVAVAAYIGYRIFKSAVYLGITYLAGTWLLLFLTFHVSPRPSAIVFTLGLIALAVNIVIRVIGDKVHSLSVYNYVITIVAVAYSLLMFTSKDSYFVAVGCAFTALALILFSKIRKEAGWFYSFVMLLSVWSAVHCAAETDRMPYLMAGAIGFIALSSILYRLFKVDNSVSHIANGIGMLLAFCWSYLGNPKLTVHANVALLLAFVMMMIASMKAEKVWEQAIDIIISGLAVITLSITSPDILSVFIDENAKITWQNDVIRISVAIFCYLVCLATIYVFRKKDILRLRVFLWVVGGFIQIFSIVALADLKRNVPPVAVLGAVYLVIGGILILCVEALLFHLASEKSRGYSEIALILAVIGSLACILINSQIYGYKLLQLEMASFVRFGTATVIMLVLQAHFINSERRGVPAFSSFKKGLDKVLFYGVYSFTVLSLLLISFSFVDENSSLIAILLAELLPVMLLVVETEFGQAKWIQLPNMFMYAIVVRHIVCKISRVDADLFNLIPCAMVLLIVIIWNIVARKLHKKMLGGKGDIDFISWGTMFMAFTIGSCGWHAFTFRLVILGVPLINTIGRTKKEVDKVLTTIGTTLMAIAAARELSRLNEFVVVEAILLVVVVESFVIRYLVKPAKDSALAIFTFMVVAVCMFIEFVHALSTGSLLALILLGVFSLAIFSFAFIKHEKRWFVQGVIELGAMAIYMGVAYWGSFIWWVYLLIAGIVAISLAAGNEMKKKKAAETGEEAKKMFDNWTW